MPPNARKLFHKPPAGAAGRGKIAEAVFRDHPEAFETVKAAHRFLERIVMPASCRWAYCTNAKVGTTSILNSMFQIEFGVPLKATLNDPRNPNPDQISHKLDVANVFYRLDQFAGAYEALPNAFRFSAVRDPFQRAVSSFRYVCSSQAQGSQMFFRDRVRLNATKFDWDVDPGTARGFRKFLDYVEMEMKRTPRAGLNAHYRPQWMNVDVDRLKPHMLFRLEDLDDALERIAAALGATSAVSGAAPVRLNRASAGDADNGKFDTAEVRARVRSIYDADYALYEEATGRISDWPIHPAEAHA
ncbi:sulfotransferase family 2 domain-containing protein [Sulfitobacter sp. LCG007]